MHIETYNNIKNLPESAHQIFAQYEELSLFLGHSWFEIYEQHFLDSKNSVFITVTNKNHQVIAMLLLKKSKSGKKLHSISNYYSALFSPLIKNSCSDQEIIQAFSLIVKNYLFFQDIHQIELNPIKQNTRENQLFISALKEHQLIIDLSLYTGNWFYPVAVNNFSEYFLQLPSKLKNTIKRKNKKLHKDQHFLIKIYSSAADINEYVSEYEEIYQASWKVAEGSKDFIRHFMCRYAKNGETRLAVAYLNGIPAASQFWLIHKEQALIYKLAYDPKYKHYSIGTLLTAKMIENAIETEKVKLIDYLTGDDHYKQDWMSHRDDLESIIAYNPYTLCGAFLGIKHLLKQFFKKYLLQIQNKYKKQTSYRNTLLIKAFSKATSKHNLRAIH